MRDRGDEVVALKDWPLQWVRVENSVCPVMGEGGQRAWVMCIGEAPGRNGAKTG